MTKLGQASVVRLGTQIVSRIYAGAKQAWPLPYLDPSVGIATTPDAADLDVGIGTIRWTFQARSTKDVYDAVDQFIAGQWTSSGVGAWFAGYRPANGGFILGTIDTASVRRDILAIPTINFNKNVPLWFRVELTPQIDATHSQLKGFMSNDYGETWTLITTDTSYPPLLDGLRDSTAVLTVGSHGATPRWAGQVYSVQAEEIDRAQLIFPGVIGNWVATPGTGVAITGNTMEVVARIAHPNWDTAITTPAEGFIWKDQAFLVRRIPSGNSLQFAVYYAAGLTLNAQVSITPGLFPANQPIWLKMTMNADNGAGAWVATISYNLTNTVHEPTTWTAMAGTLTGTPQRTFYNGPGALVYVGTDHNTRASRFRIARLIVRNGIAGPAVLDVADADAGRMVTSSTFVARSGQTMTVVERQPVAFMFPGITGNYMTVPDSAALDIVGDLEIVAHLDPAGGVWNAQAGDVVNKYLSTGVQRSYRFYISATGVPSIVLSADGATGVTTGSASGLGAQTVPLWVKVTRQAGVIKFYTAPSAAAEPTTWTQLGSDRATTVTGNLFVSTAPVWIGDVYGGAGPYKGRIRQVIVRAGIAGTIVANVNEDNATVGATSFTATTGGTVAVVQTAGNTIVQQDMTVPASDIVQPQPNLLMWRFDPDDHTSGTTWTDPRGRAWTLSAAGTIVRPSAPT